MIKTLLFLSFIPVFAQKPAPLELERSIPLAGVSGRIDHMAIDVEGRHLFVAALGNHTVEVIDLAAGKVSGRITGLGEPQGLAWTPEFGKLFAADGADGTVRVYSGAALRRTQTLKLGSDADNLRYEAPKKRVWAGFGDGALAAIDASTGKLLSEIKLDGHPESFQLEANGPAIFVNVPSAGHIAVIDRERRTVVAKWPLLGEAANFPMALDERNHRVFVGCRKPPRLMVYDTNSGKQVEMLTIHGDTDDLFQDAQRSRLYVICGEGYIDVPGSGSVQTAPGARTGLYVRALDRLYVAVPHRGAQKAEIRVYRPGPVSGKR